MKVSEALEIVLELANDNIIDDDEFEGERERQEEAVRVVEEHLDVVRGSEGPVVIEQGIVLDVPDGMRVATKEQDGFDGFTSEGP